MFRETYKNAINDIETNKELLNVLLNKADDSKAPSARTAVFLRRLYAVSGFAAAAAAVVVSVIALNNGDFENDKKLAANDNSVKYESTADNGNSDVSEKKSEIDRNTAAVPEQGFTEQTAENTAADLEKKPENTEAKQENVKSSEVTESVKAPKEAFYDKAPSDNAERAEIFEKSETTDQSALTEEITEDASVSNNTYKYTEKAILEDSSSAAALENIPEEAVRSEKSSGGSGGSSVAAYSEKSVMFSSMNSVEEWTMKEYCDYLGFNVEESLDLPKDMVNETGRTVYVSIDSESGEISQDECCFYYRGDNGRFVSVITSKDVDYTEKMLKDNSFETKDVNGQIWAVVSESGEYKTVATVKDDVSFTVDSCKLTENEQDKIMISIGKIKK